MREYPLCTIDCIELELEPVITDIVWARGAEAKKDRFVR